MLISEKRLHVQQIHSNFIPICQIVKGHIKVSQNRFWYTEQEKNGFSKNFVLSLLHDQTWVGPFMKIKFSSYKNYSQ